mgnify:CR=1 FL=1
MLRTDPVSFQGNEIMPIQFLKALLPDPASLGPRTVGKTNIGCIFAGVKDGKEKSLYTYNVCDRQECYRELGSKRGIAFFLWMTYTGSIRRKADKELADDMTESFKNSSMYAIMHLYRGGRGFLLCPYL